MNCARITCGHSEARHAETTDADPNALPGACEVCLSPPCPRFLVVRFRADEDGNVRPPSVEIAVGHSCDPERDDEPTATFDTSDVDNDPERTKP